MRFPFMFEIIEEAPFTVLVPYGNRPAPVHGVALDGKLWLVPEWLESEEDKMCIPKRMIRFDDHPHEKIDHTFQMPHRYLVLQPIGTDVLLGFSSVGFEILQGAEVTVGFRSESLPDISHDQGKVAG